MSYTTKGDVNAEKLIGLWQAIVYTFPDDGNTLTALKK